MSVAGVAIATTVSQAVSAIWVLILLMKRKGYGHFDIRRMKLDGESFWHMIRIGVPAGIQGALFALSNMLIQSSIVTVNNNIIGTESKYAPVVNGNAAAGNIDSFVYMAMNAVYQGTITVASQNVGANKLDRIKRVLYSCLLASLCVGVTVSGIAYIFREPLLALYGIKGGEGLDAVALESALVRFNYMVLPYFLCGIMEVCCGVLRGMGKSIVSTVISLVGSCLLRVVWLLSVFPLRQTLPMIYISYPVTWLITAGAMFITIKVLLKGMMKKQRESLALASATDSEEVVLGVEDESI
jgi:Na+-driven multidrug efflux pump